MIKSKFDPKKYFKDPKTRTQLKLSHQIKQLFNIGMYIEVRMPEKHNIYMYNNEIFADRYEMLISKQGQERLEEAKQEFRKKFLR